jgi:hypothetical protein
MATNLFESFPRISYTLNDGDTEEVVVDIFKRIILSKEFQENTSYFETYDVRHGETPEELAFRFYGTENLHWLILMVNNIIDPRFEWPISEENLIKSVESKYGGVKDIFTKNRALNAKGYQVETFFILTEDSTHKKPKRLIIESPDEFGINQPVVYQESAEIASYQTNYDVEEIKNESYRSIKILKAAIVQDVVTNYQKLINI